MESTPRKTAEPGTLLWVGPTAHAEFGEAYRFCRDHVAQIAVRRSLREAIRRPAGYVRRIIVPRPTRQTPPRSVWDLFTARYRGVPSVALCSSLCDGEGRTGSPLPANVTLRFSRWRELLPLWLADCGVSPAVTHPVHSLLVNSAQFEMAEPYLNAASDTGATVSWHRRFIPAVHRGFETVLWDDSSAPPASSSIWQQRLGRSESKPAEKQGSPDRRVRTSDSTEAHTQQASTRHLWLALQPSVVAIDDALSGGITSVLSKPVKLESIFSTR